MNGKDVALPIHMTHDIAVRYLDAVRSGHKSVRFVAAILRWTPEQVQVCAFGEVVQ